MNLDYFISSLPMLLEGQPAHITIEAFRAAADSQLSPRLHLAVRALLDGTDSPHPFVRAWREIDAIICNEIAVQRTIRRGQQLTQAPRMVTAACIPSIAPAISVAFAESDPLRRERAIAHIRWAQIDQLQGVQPLSENVVLAYAVKLKLNETLLSAQTSKGAECFQALTKQ